MLATGGGIDPFTRYNDKSDRDISQGGHDKKWR
jgi:hypothetical protein